MSSFVSHSPLMHSESETMTEPSSFIRLTDPATGDAEHGVEPIEHVAGVDIGQELPARALG